MPVVEPLLIDAVPPRWSQRWRALLGAQRVEPWLLHSLMAVPVSILPSVALFSLANAAAAAWGLDVAALSPPDRTGSLGEFLGSVLFAPVAETLLMALLLRGWMAVLRRPVAAAAASGLAWGVLHGLLGPLWFFGTAWSFYVFSASYLAWRPVSRARAFAVAALAHATINAIALTLVRLS